MSLVGGTPEAIELAATTQLRWREAGADGAFLARELATGAELGFAVDLPLPMASVVKVPIALVACDLIAAGELDPALPVRVDPAVATPGPTGLATFRYPATLALHDLLALMLSVSDNAAGDAVVDLIGLDAIQRRLRDWDCAGVLVRHRLRALYDSVAMLANDDLAVALELAVRSGRGGDHPLPVLDVAAANTGTARGLVDLLARIWTDRISVPAATAELRGLLGRQVFRHRLAGELDVDGNRLHGKTGTMLNLRHEIGVVETDTGEVIVIAALTRSEVPAFAQPEVEHAIATAARAAVDLLR